MFLPHAISTPRHVIGKTENTTAVVTRARESSQTQSYDSIKGTARGRDILCSSMKTRPLSPGFGAVAECQQLRPGIGNVVNIHVHRNAAGARNFAGPDAFALGILIFARRV